MHKRDDRALRRFWKTVHAIERSQRLVEDLMQAHRADVDLFEDLAEIRNRLEEVGGDLVGMSGRIGDGEEESEESEEGV